MKNRAIFDNGGGITLQLGDFAHHYNDPAQAAQDWAAYQQSKSKNTSDWEGHEEESASLEPTQDEIRNGGYRVMDAEDIANLDKGDEETVWHNMDAFLSALRAQGKTLSI